MFNWLKKLFIRPEEQGCVVFHLINIVETDEEPVKQNRKYVRSGKYIKKNKKKGEK